MKLKLHARETQDASYISHGRRVPLISSMEIQGTLIDHTDTPYQVRLSYRPAGAGRNAQIHGLTIDGQPVLWSPRTQPLLEALVEALDSLVRANCGCIDYEAPGTWEAPRPSTQQIQPD